MDSPDRCITLERRLHTGWTRIRIEEVRGHDASSLERFWLALLHEYEQCVKASSAPQPVDDERQQGAA